MDSLLSLLFGLIGTWYVWLPIAGVLGYLAFRNNLRAKTLQELEHTLLIIEAPSVNDKKEIAAEELFASLHSMLRSKRELAAQGGLQEHVSFEIAASQGHINFYVWMPSHMRNFIENQLYTQYPNVQIYEAPEDYSERRLHQRAVYTAELALTSTDVLPIKTARHFDGDSLSSIIGALAKLNSDEELWIQVLMRPIADEWHRRANRFIGRLQSGGGKTVGSSAGKYAARMFEALSRPPDNGSQSVALTEREKQQISEAENKMTKPAFRAKIRIVGISQSAPGAKLNTQAIISNFKQFSAVNANGFRLKRAAFSVEGLAEYRARFFIDRGFILNSEELASIFHLPQNLPSETGSRTTNKTVEPPATLPVVTGEASDKEVSLFGLASYRGDKQQFGIYRSDRARHIYVVGEPSTGKSGLLELLALSDLFHGHGYAIIDLDGDAATNNLRFIHAARSSDVLHINPADTAHPVGFNPLEVDNPALKGMVCGEVTSVLKRLIGSAWNARTEHVMRYTLLALLDYPHATLLEISRMLTEPAFRSTVLAHCHDAVVHQFWTVEFASWGERVAAETIAPILNKLGAFTASPIIRNIVGQSKSSFNLRGQMDDGKIVIINLAKGLVGEENAGILGAFFVSSLYIAALGRAKDATPFYVYIDDFQALATDSFGAIFTESRKYSLNFAIANQQVSQLAPLLRDAILNNAGTLVSFRASPNDAPLLAKHFEPAFASTDLERSANRHFVTTMTVRGEKSHAFSADTLALPTAPTDNSAQIINHSRHHYARARHDVELEMHHRFTQ